MYVLKLTNFFQQILQAVDLQLKKDENWSKTLTALSQTYMECTFVNTFTRSRQCHPNKVFQKGLVKKPEMIFCQNSSRFKIISVMSFSNGSQGQILTGFISNTYKTKTLRGHKRYDQKNIYKAREGNFIVYDSIQIKVVYLM